MATNYLLNVPKLKGRENYGDWAFAIENVLILEGLAKCVSEVVSAEDSKAKAKIILTIDPSLYVHIREAKTTVDLWKKLKSMFDDSGFARRINLLRTLISTRLEKCDSMTSYVNQIVDNGQKLRGTGFAINDEWIGSLLLAGLPEKYSPMIMAIEHSGIPITTDAIKSKLLDMEEEVTTTGSAFRAKSWQSKQKFSHRNVSTVGNQNKKDVVCYKCKKPGHFKSRCPNSDNDVRQNKTSNVFSAVFISGSFNKSDWYVDSGASVHLTANEKWMKNRANDVNMHKIMAANQTEIPVLCSGEVDLTTVVGKNFFDITVKNVVCAPELTTNLLSVSRLIEQGNFVEFNSDQCKIYNKHRELVATADLINGVYKLNIDRRGDFLGLVTASDWHRRLGHLNAKDLIKMKNGAVEGMVCEDFNINISKQNCVVCNEGKQTRQPFPHGSSRASKPLEIVHADLCGPMEVMSLGGAKYFLILEDDYTRMGFVYFLKTKDETSNKFQEFQKMAENQQETKIKTVRTDNGKEFCCVSFDSLLKKHGIIHQLTNSYTPEQNGLAERLNRTVVEKARCLLFDGKLDKRFWAEAVNSAVYLRNRSVSSSLGNKTPYELWTGKIPNISHLRIIGSKVMVHIPKVKRTKWDKKAKEMILVGYSNTTKGYRLYDPEANDVVISRDVTIMENIDDAEKEIKNHEEIITSVGDDEENEKSDTVSKEDLHDASKDIITSEKETDVKKPVTPKDEEKNIRRSQRQIKPNTRFDDYELYFSAGTSDQLEDPTTVEEARSRPDAEEWKRAMDEELQAFEDNNAWELVDLPESASVVQCKWVFKRKVNSEGKVQHRARLVARGFTQKPGVDYDETFSPVVRHSTLRLLMALSVELDLNITHLDVKTAFLNGILQEDIFLQQPEGLNLYNDKRKVLKLKRAMYGLKQSSRVWNQRVNDVLSCLGYNRSNLEPCLFTKHKENGLVTMIALYVDDFYIFSNDTNETEFLKSKLSSEFEVKDLGMAKNCLGMEIKHDRVNGVLALSQENYIDQLLKRFNMTDCKTVKTPIETKLDFLNETENKTDDVPYQALIGSLMYLSVLTRPDISFSVSYLSQYNNSYTDKHWACAKRILRYLKETKNYVLKFKKGDLELRGYVDADWANCSLDRKSYTGFIFKLCGSVISWQSAKQKTVALSSTEAEYMALSEACREAIYLRNLLYELISYNKCITLFNDNQSALNLSVDASNHKRSKHIDVRHHYIREAVSNKVVKTLYLQTDEMPADIMTKGLRKEKHYEFLKCMGLGIF